MLCKFISFKPKGKLVKLFVESLFEVIYVYEFQRTANSYEEFVESQYEIMSVYEFQTKANYYEDNC